MGELGGGGPRSGWTPWLMEVRVPQLTSFVGIRMTFENISHNYSVIAPTSVVKLEIVRP